MFITKVSLCLLLREVILPCESGITEKKLKLLSALLIGRGGGAVLIIAALTLGVSEEKEKAAATDNAISFFNSMFSIEAFNILFINILYISFQLSIVKYM